MSLSKWTHACCADCWNRMHPSRDPVAMIDAEHEDCCFCEGFATNGIYVRRDPTDPELNCGKAKKAVPNPIGRKNEL